MIKKTRRTLPGLSANKVILQDILVWKDRPKSVQEKKECESIPAGIDPSAL
jgi:hypothetical protein